MRGVLLRLLLVFVLAVSGCSRQAEETIVSPFAVRSLFMELSGDDASKARSALSSIERKAERGDSFALMALGWLEHLNGNDARAETLFSQAAPTQGDAAYNAAMLAMARKDRTRALEMLLEACRDSPWAYPQAAYWIGRFARETGKPLGGRNAVEWMQIAADRGVARAEVEVGRLLASGTGSDALKGLDVLRRAASKGNRSGRHALIEVLEKKVDQGERANDELVLWKMLEAAGSGTKEAQALREFQALEPDEQASVKTRFLMYRGIYNQDIYEGEPPAIAIKPSFLFG